MARQGRAERAVGPARCRLTAACRVRRGGERVSRRRGERAQSRASPCPPAPFPCAATLVPVPLSSARFPLPGLFVSAPTRGGAAGLCPAGGRARVGRARRVASGACGRCGHPGAGTAVSAVRHAEDHRGASGVVLRDRRLRPVVVAAGPGQPRVLEGRSNLRAEEWAAGIAAVADTWSRTWIRRLRKRVAACAYEFGTERDRVKPVLWVVLRDELMQRVEQTRSWCPVSMVREIRMLAGVQPVDTAAQWAKAISTSSRGERLAPWRSHSSS